MAEAIDTVTNIPFAASEEVWTTNYSIEHLKQELATFSHDIKNDESGEIVQGRKYYDQAIHLQYRVGLHRPVPFFEISLSDLSQRMVRELRHLDVKSREYVLKQAVARIFEDLNCEQYHNSVSSILKAKLVK